MPVTFVTLKDAAGDLGLASSTLRHQIRLKRFQATKIGRGWFVVPAEVERYRAENRRPIKDIVA